MLPFISKHELVIISILAGIIIVGGTYIYTTLVKKEINREVIIKQRVSAMPTPITQEKVFFFKTTLGESIKFGFGLGIGLFLASALGFFLSLGIFGSIMASIVSSLSMP